MSCPHSTHDAPDRCSQCLGYPARRISQLGDTVTDGETARPIDAESAQLRARYAHKTRRG